MFNFKILIIASFRIFFRILASILLGIILIFIVLANPLLSIFIHLLLLVFLLHRHLIFLKSRYKIEKYLIMTFLINYLFSLINLFNFALFETCHFILFILNFLIITIHFYISILDFARF